MKFLCRSFEKGEDNKLKRKTKRLTAADNYRERVFCRFMDFWSIASNFRRVSPSL